MNGNLRIFNLIIENENSLKYFILDIDNTNLVSSHKYYFIIIHESSYEMVKINRIKTFFDFLKTVNIKFSVLKLDSNSESDLIKYLCLNDSNLDNQDFGILNDYFNNAKKLHFNDVYKRL